MPNNTARTIVTAIILTAATYYLAESSCSDIRNAFQRRIQPQIKTEDRDGRGNERFIDIGNERFYSQRDGHNLKNLFEDKGYRITTNF